MDRYSYFSYDFDLVSALDYLAFIVITFLTPLIYDKDCNSRIWTIGTIAV